MRIAVFKLANSSFDSYFNNLFRKNNIDVFPLEDYFIIDESYKDVKINYLDLLSLNIKQYDCIIVFDKPKILPFLKLRKNRKAKLILWYWNIHHDYSRLKNIVVSNLCEIWTFDPYDSEHHGWHLNNQFFELSDSNYSINSINNVVFLAMLDKNRYSFVKSLKSLVEENGLTCDFNLVKDGSSSYLEEDSEWLKETWVDYYEILDRVSKSTYLIDIVQSGQTGMTLRTLEALFFNKKLITNNKMVLTMDFYNKNNIFVIDDNFDQCEFKQFLNEKYVDIDIEIIEKYKINSWISNFL